MPGYRRITTALRQRFDEHGANPFIRFAPPGHFYSPLPSLDLVDRDRSRLFRNQITEVPGIDLNVRAQLALIRQMAASYRDLPFTDDRSEDRRYYFRNPFFSYGDAIVLYGMMRHLRPRRIIEVGSGFSSAVMLDTNELFLSRTTALTFIEPYPERLYSLLSDEDRTQHEIVVDVVQNVDVRRFQALQPKDILFIDSSHVAKIGSDVVHLLTQVLPRLESGVIIHFHDIFWPFEYPEEWIREGRAWNEAYLLKAFLQFNASFRILCFNSYLAIHHSDLLKQTLPLVLNNAGASLWVEKIA